MLFPGIDMLLKPDVYAEQLDEANFYEFALTIVASSALNEVRELDPKLFGEDLDENPLVTLNLTTEDLVSSLNQAIPPAWVQAHVEQLINEAGGYVTGEIDEFKVHVDATDQAPAITSEIKATVLKSDAYAILFAGIVTPIIRDAATYELALGVTVTEERLDEAVRNVASRQWFQVQVESAVDQVMPFITGDKDSFEVIVSPTDRIDVALNEVEMLLRERNAYDILFDEVISPALTDSIGEAVVLPLGVAVSKDEIVAALRRAAPPDWVWDQVNNIVDNAVPYLTGTTDSLNVSVSLANNKHGARDLLLGIVRNKLRQSVDTRLPELEIALAVDSVILAVVPDTINFTDSQIRESLVIGGADANLDLLDDIREIFKDGWVYTDQDIRQDIDSRFGPDANAWFENVRAALSKGWTYTHEDLRRDLADVGGQPALDSLDRSRSISGWVSILKYLIFLPAATLVIGIGFLGGRRWTNRVIWPAVTVALVSAVILVVTLVVNGLVGSPTLLEAKQEVISQIDDEDNFYETQHLVVEKTFEIVASALSDFIRGVVVKSSVSLGIAVAALMLAVGWSKFRRVLPIPLLHF